MTMDICDELEAKASTVHGGAYSAMHKARKKIQRLRLELDAAQKDAARLDWLDENPDRIRRSTGYLGSASSWTVRDNDGVAHDFISARAAIDAAMATQESPPPVHPAAPAVQRTPADPAQPATCCAGPDPAPTDRP